MRFAMLTFTTLLATGIGSAFATSASVLFEIQSQCWSTRREQEGALLDRMLPESCDQLLPSFLALLEFVESNRTTTSKQHFDCARDVAPRHAAELVRSCASGSLSVRAAYVELDERVSRACPR
jgi:hypothetical protein